MTALPPPTKYQYRAPVQAPPTTSEKWYERIGRSGYFIGALLFHVLLFILLATLIVFRAPVLDSDATFRAVKIEPPVPPTLPAPAGGDSANNLEPALQTTPPAAAPAAISVNVANDFAMKATKVTLPNLPAAMTLPSSTAIAGHGATGPAEGTGSVFGTADSSGPAQLEGHLFDLKQTADRQPTNMSFDGYHAKIAEFIAGDWNPDILRPYYRASVTLHTSSIFVPIIKADDGPKAFGVEDEVKPCMYCMWYKVTAAPTQDGTYHFVGVADDILAVRVNHRTVLDGSLYTVAPDVREKQTKYNMTNFLPTIPEDGDFWVSKPFQVSAHEPVEIEILIGEQPGGQSDYFLFIQRDESTYDKQSNGAPLLPIFQLDSKPIEPVGPAGSFPPFATTPEPWEAVTPAP